MKMHNNGKGVIILGLGSVTAGGRHGWYDVVVDGLRMRIRKPLGVARTSWWRRLLAWLDKILSWFYRSSR